jgi:transcriptional regulator with XRE-family HTH domain
MHSLAAVCLSIRFSTLNSEPIVLISQDFLESLILMLTNLNARIRETRRIANISRAELARRIGVKPSAAAQWEYDDGTAPTVSNLIKIAVATAVSFEWLATGRGPARDNNGHHETPAIQQEAFAHTLFEEQLLILAREMPVAWQSPLILFLRTVLRKKT